jgi:hypothetical protein
MDQLELCFTTLGILGIYLIVSIFHSNCSLWVEQKLYFVF